MPTLERLALPEVEANGMAQIARAQIGRQHTVVPLAEFATNDQLSGGERPQLAFLGDEGSDPTPIDGFYWDAANNRPERDRFIPARWTRPLTDTTAAMGGIEPDYAILSEERAGFVWVTDEQGLHQLIMHRRDGQYTGGSILAAWIGQSWRLVGFCGEDPGVAAEKMRGEMPRRQFDQFMDNAFASMEGERTSGLDWGEDDDGNEQMMYPDDWRPTEEFSRELRSRFVQTDCRLIDAVRVAAELAPEFGVAIFPTYQIGF